jgi:acyl-coenzyme A thioesterase PaaI-like protein
VTDAQRSLTHGSGRLVGPPHDLCLGCQRFAECRFGVRSIRLFDDGAASADVEFTDVHEGGPGVAHGGWTAGMFDEVLGRVLSNHRGGMITVTRDITVRYRRPVPINHRLLVEVRAEPHGDGRWTMHGQLLIASSGADLGSASGVWVERDGSRHFERHQRWLEEQGSPAGTA